MSQYLFPALFTLFIWWFSTGVIMYLGRLPRWTFKWTFLKFTLLLGFALVCVFGQRDLQVLRGFMDEVVYGLSDSAKAFAIILATDIFVGFHSPEGWTVLLDGIAHHLGLPAKQNFIMLFIATFPVVLATIFKYWIFRYLNRVSPSSVATLRNMNGGG
jgi:hypothetical protein